MGYEVISFCTLEIKQDKIQEAINKIRQNEIFDLEINENEISFKISGNKTIDYSFFEELKPYCSRIYCGEYVETGEGFYYDEEDVEVTS